MDIGASKSAKKGLVERKQKKKINIFGQNINGGDPYQAIASIATKVDILSLVDNIKDRASAIYKKLEKNKSVKCRNLNAVAAACVYLACRQEGKPRTLKEICSIVIGTTKKEIYKATECIIKQLKVKLGEPMEMATTQPGDHVRRFCFYLGMSSKEIKAVEETIEKVENMDIRRSPISIAATIIYMITQLSDSRKPLRDIAAVTTSSEVTIKIVYRELYPLASKIIPKWYANTENLMKWQWQMEA